MSNVLNLDEVEAVFTTMGLPLADRSIEEIQKAKDNFFAPQQQKAESNVTHRVVVTNGSGSLSKGSVGYAELERGSR